MAKKNSSEASKENDSDARPVGSRAGFTDAMPYKGAAMQIQRVDWIDKYEKIIDKVAALGFDTVSLVVDTRMENASTSTGAGRVERGKTLSFVVAMRMPRGSCIRALISTSPALRA